MEIIDRCDNMVSKNAKSQTQDIDNSYNDLKLTN